MPFANRSAACPPCAVPTRSPAPIASHSTTSAEKSNVVLYCESLASEPRAATLLLNSPLATLFARLLHTSPSAALRLRIASVLAALLRHATLLDRGIVLETLLPALLAAQTDRAVPVRSPLRAASRPGTSASLHLML